MHAGSCLAARMLHCGGAAVHYSAPARIRPPTVDFWMLTDMRIAGAPAASWRGWPGLSIVARPSGAGGHMHLFRQHAVKDHAAAAALVPVIDYGPYFAGAPGALERLAEELRHACQTVGFFY